MPGGSVRWLPLPLLAQGGPRWRRRFHRLGTDPRWGLGIRSQSRSGRQQRTDTTLTRCWPVAITPWASRHPATTHSQVSSGESSRSSRHHRSALPVRRTYLRAGVRSAAAIRGRLPRALPRVRRRSCGVQPGVGRDDVRRSGHLLLRPGHEQMRGLRAAQSGTEPVHERMPAVRRALRGADRVTPGDGAAQRDPGDEPGLPSQAPRSRSAMAHPIDLPT